MLRFWTFLAVTALISREKLSKHFGLKTRENVGDVHFLVVDNFDFPRKNCFVKIELLDQNLTFRKVYLQ